MVWSRSAGRNAGPWHTVTVTQPPYPEPPAPAFLFDLDGTLIDSVYQHVIAWRAALARLDIDLSVWRIHRRIGMSGGLFVSALLRETGRSLSSDDIAMLQQAHAEEYLAQADSVRPLPGAADLLAALTERRVPWAIATSGYRATAEHALAMLGLAAARNRSGSGLACRTRSRVTIGASAARPSMARACSAVAR